MNKRISIKRLTLLGMFAAITILFIALYRAPLIPAAPYLEYDAGDVPIILMSVFLGPWYGLMLTIVASVLQGIVFSSASGWVGVLMHIFATGILSIVVGYLSAFLKKHISETTAVIIAIVCGAAAMTAVMIPLNLVFTPLYSGMPMSAVRELIVPAILPFNALKAGINGVLSFLVWLPLRNPAKKFI